MVSEIGLRSLSGWPVLVRSQQSLGPSLQTNDLQPRACLMGGPQSPQTSNPRPERHRASVFSITQKSRGLYEAGSGEAEFWTRLGSKIIRSLAPPSPSGPETPVDGGGVYYRLMDEYRYNVLVMRPHYHLFGSALRSPTCPF